MGYCGVAGVSDEEFTLDEYPDTEPLFEEADVLEAGSLFDEDDVLETELLFEEDDVLETETLFEEDEVSEVEFNFTTGSFSSSVEESFVAGVLSSAAAGIALYKGESTITAARIKVSSFALVFFMLLLLKLYWIGFYCIIKRSVSGKTERTQQNCFLRIIRCLSTARLFTWRCRIRRKRS